MMYEIRNYHFDPALFEDYKAWAKSEALPYLSNALDLVGFWTNLPEESDIIGDTIPDWESLTGVEFDYLDFIES